MRFAVLFGVAAFLVSGSLFNAFAHDAEGVLGLAFIVGVAAAIYGAHIQAQHEHATDNPGGKIYHCNKQLAFHRIKDILLSHRLGSDTWSFSQLDPEQGRLSATLLFHETLSAFGPTHQLQNSPRRITMHATVTNPSGQPNQSIVQLSWSVTSPINRDTCDSVIHHISRSIDTTLSNPALLVR